MVLDVITSDGQPFKNIINYFTIRTSRRPVLSHYVITFGTNFLKSFITKTYIQKNLNKIIKSDANHQIYFVYIQ